MRDHSPILRPDPEQEDTNPKPKREAYNRVVRRISSVIHTATEYPRQVKLRRSTSYNKL